MNINFDPAGRQHKGPVAQVLTAILGVLFLAGALMFSLVFFAVIAVAGLVLWVWFRWKTRALRKQIREQMQAQSVEAPDLEPMEEGEVIAGEVIRVVDEGNRLVHQAGSLPIDGDGARDK